VQKKFKPVEISVQENCGSSHHPWYLYVRVKDVIISQQSYMSKSYAEKAIFPTLENVLKKSEKELSRVSVTLNKVLTTGKYLPVIRTTLGKGKDEKAKQKLIEKRLAETVTELQRVGRAIGALCGIGVYMPTEGVFHGTGLEGGGID
jgi:hypothetical protein